MGRKALGKEGHFSFKSNNVNLIEQVGKPSGAGRVVLFRVERFRKTKSI